MSDHFCLRTFIFRLVLCLTIKSHKPTTMIVIAVHIPDTATQSFNMSRSVLINPVPYCNVLSH